jgi:hypothetical protein
MGSSTAAVGCRRALSGKGGHLAEGRLPRNHCGNNPQEKLLAASACNWSSGGRVTSSATQSDEKHNEGEQLIILGIILLIVGFIAKVAIIWTIGIILVVIGAILFLLGTMGRAVGGRRHYF